MNANIGRQKQSGLSSLSQAKEAQAARDNAKAYRLAKLAEDYLCDAMAGAPGDADIFLGWGNACEILAQCGNDNAEAAEYLRVALDAYNTAFSLSKSEAARRQASEGLARVEAAKRR
jgi:hypothetical protein